ncbi:EamA family transporter [Ectothiorhodospiraceae bacterium WFHF3C12]|nr:EamA family transporter [Ectothiorhodospiraceae bacterium WFHF3C12]
MYWLPLTLLCALSLASADAYTKARMAGNTAGELTLIRFAVTGLLLSPLLVWHPPGPLPAAFWGWVGAAVPLEVLAMVLYMRAIQTSPLSLTLPYLAFTPVFTTASGALLLGERVSVTGFAGIGLVVTGSYLLNAGRDDHAPRDWLTPLRAIAREPGSRLMLAVAFIYSLTSVLGKGALQYAPPLTFGPLYFAILGTAVLVWNATARPARLRGVVRSPTSSLAVGGLMAVMILTHFAALAQVETAYMISVKRTSLLFGIVYGWLLFREGELSRRLFAGSLMVAGVAAIVFSAAGQTPA